MSERVLWIGLINPVNKMIFTAIKKCPQHEECHCIRHTYVDDKIMYGNRLYNYIICTTPVVYMLLKEHPAEAYLRLEGVIDDMWFLYFFIRIIPACIYYWGLYWARRFARVDRTFENLLTQR